MTVLRARVKDGRFVIDEPAELPEGASVDLLVLDAGDAMSDADGAALEASIDRGLEEATRGEVVEAAQVFDRLRRV